jgi:cytochrome c oxidase subunit 2
LDGFDVITPQGRDITGLFIVALVISALVFLLVLGLLAWVLIRFRERPADAGRPEPSQVSGNRALETIWTVTPALILATMFVLSVRTMGAVYASVLTTSPEAGLAVEVVGHQFWWEYRYPQQGRDAQATVVTANELHLPVGAPVRLEISAGDVLHDFWVPQLGWKHDAITGKVNVLPARLERAGVYDGVCTNYCGVQHAWMRIRVVAEPPEQFEAWLANQAQPVRPGSRRADRVPRVPEVGSLTGLHGNARPVLHLRSSPGQGPPASSPGCTQHRASTGCGSPRLARGGGNAGAVMAREVR